jgi:hypothetical protein
MGVHAFVSVRLFANRAVPASLNTAKRSEN